MKYFKDMANTAEAKKHYRTLVKRHHPDAGGSDETMKAINAEFEIVLRILPTTETKPEVDMIELIVKNALERLWNTKLYVTENFIALRAEILASRATAGVDITDKMLKCANRLEVEYLRATA